MARPRGEDSIFCPLLPAGPLQPLWVSPCSRTLRTDRWMTSVRRRKVILDFGLAPHLTSVGRLLRRALTFSEALLPTVLFTTVSIDVSSAPLRRVKKLVDFHSISVSHLAYAHQDPTILSRIFSARSPPLPIGADLWRYSEILQDSA